MSCVLTRQSPDQSSRLIFSADECLGRDVLKSQCGVASPVPTPGSALSAIPGEEELQAWESIL